MITKELEEKTNLSAENILETINSFISISKLSKVFVNSSILHSLDKLGYIKSLYVSKHIKK